MLTKVYVVLIQNGNFQKLKSRLILIRGLMEHNPAVLEMVSTVETKTRLIACTATRCKVLIMRRAQTSGRCPNIMVSASGINSLNSVFISRSLPEATRELIVGAYVRKLTLPNSSAFVKPISTTRGNGYLYFMASSSPLVLIMRLRFQGFNRCRDWYLP